MSPMSPMSPTSTERSERGQVTRDGGSTAVADLPGPSVVLRRAGGENFPVALRVLPRRLRRDLMALYGYARLVDWAGDEAGGDRLALLTRLEGQVRELDLDAGGALHPLVAALREPVTSGRLPVAPLRDLIAANRQDQHVTRYERFDDLLGYCRLSANPVGRAVLHLVGQATPQRLAASDDVCTALQLIEHTQDVVEDARAGRIYLPQEDLRRFAVSESDLARRPTPPPVRRLLAFEAERAASLLDRGAGLVRMLRGPARVAVIGFVSGGRAALEALRRSSYDVGDGAPRPTRRQQTAALTRTWWEARR